MPLRVLVSGLVLLLLACGPAIFPSYLVFQLTGVLAYAVAAIGLNLITGYTGQISLGHNAFFALGAYVSALSMIHLDAHYAVSVLIAAVVTFAVGLMAGFPAQRLKGLYLALITLVLAVAVAPVIKYFKAVTGGVSGLTIDRPSAPTWMNLKQDDWVYFVVLAFAVLCFFLAKNFSSGSTNRTLNAVRQIPLAASSLGINVSGYKILIFGIGSMFAGIGGALFNFVTGFIAPDSFTLTLSIGFLAAAVVGGLGTISGALVAGLFLQFVPSFASDISETLAGAVYGAILILCMFFMPKGIVGTLLEKHRRVQSEAQGPASSRARVAS